MTVVEYCEIHGCGTELLFIALGDPLRARMKQTPAYIRAKREQFPHCDDVVDARASLTAPETAEVPICSECCKKRDAFVLEHYPLWSKSHELSA